MKVALKKITPLIGILFFGVAVWFLGQELRQYDLSEITGQLSQIPTANVVASLILSFMSYLVLTGYDGLGIAYIGERLRMNRIIRAGFISYAFSHNIGMALVTGGSMRYRLYSLWGFTGVQVTQIVAFSALTLWVGFCTVAGLSLLFASPELPDNVPFLPLMSMQILGLILLIMVGFYLWGSIRVQKKVRIGDCLFSFPDLTVAVQQIILASADWMMAAAVLYVLLPGSEIHFFSFLGVFLLAQIIGLFSQVPGGLGVFESVMLMYLSRYMEGSSILGMLLIYRIVYYLIPLLVAMILLGHQEYLSRREVIREAG
jgi:uncharacterized membrane protein YbhN (UPF0104 family)